jgi:hypothetical protein
MRYCYTNREKAAALGAKGQGDAILKLSLEAAGSRMREKLCCLQP